MEDVGGGGSAGLALERVQFQAGAVDGRVAVLVGGADVGAGGGQQLHQRRVALRHGQQQRRLASVVQRVDAALAHVQQQLGHLRPTATKSNRVKTLGTP